MRDEITINGVALEPLPAWDAPEWERVRVLIPESVVSHLANTLAAFGRKCSESDSEESTNGGKEHEQG